LTFAKGDIINTIQPSEESTFWWYGATKDHVGIFPFNYVDIVPDEKDNLSDSEDWVKIENSAQNRKMRALRDFEAVEGEALSFRCGDLITFMKDMDDPRSFMGVLNGRPGVFLRSHCEEITVSGYDMTPSMRSQADLPPAYDESSSVPSIGAGQRDFPLLDTKRHDIPRLDTDNLHSRPGGNKVVRALRDFRSGEVGDLSFVKGDIIEVLDMPSSSGWWKGRINDAVGVFPSSLTQVCVHVTSFYVH